MAEWNYRPDLLGTPTIHDLLARGVLRPADLEAGINGSSAFTQDGRLVYEDPATRAITYQGGGAFDPLQYYTPDQISQLTAQNMQSAANYRPSESDSSFGGLKNYGKGALEFAPYAAAFAGGIAGLQGMGVLGAGDVGASSALSGGGDVGYFDSILGDNFDDFMGGFSNEAASMYGTPPAETFGFDNLDDFLTPGPSKEIASQLSNWSNPYLTTSIGSQLLGLGKTALGALTGGSGGNGGASLGSSILGRLGSDPLGSVFSAAPFLLALAEANRQGGDVDNTIGQLQGLVDGVNPAAIRTAALNPYDAETARGRGALTMSLGQRGVLGSSFGNADITNYDTTRDLGRADLLTKADLGSTQVRAGLFDSILKAQTQKNTNRNLLLGAGLGASGKLFSPVDNDPFGLKEMARARAAGAL